MATRLYSSAQVELSWLGLDFREGLSEGSFVAFRRNTESFTMVPDGMGGAIRFYNPDRSGELDIIVEQASKLHQQLVSLAATDSVTKAVESPFVMVDNNTRERYVFQGASIKTEPDEERASSYSSDVTWTFSFKGYSHQPNPLNRNLLEPKITPFGANNF